MGKSDSFVPASPFAKFFPADLIKKKKARPTQHEMQECFAFAGFMDLLCQRHHVTWTHIPNGGHRAKKTASDLRKMGTKAGVWDYLIRKVARPVCWLEMKFGDNDLTTGQKDWRTGLSTMGDVFLVAWSAEEAMGFLKENGYFPDDAFRFVNGVLVINTLNYPPIRLQDFAQKK